MTGPEGEKAHGWWAVTAVDAPHRLEFDDGFAGDDGEPLDPTDITHTTVTIEPAGPGTRMTSVTTFASAEQLAEDARHGHGRGHAAGGRPDRRRTRRTGLTGLPGAAGQPVRPGSRSAQRPASAAHSAAVRAPSATSTS